MQRTSNIYRLVTLPSFNTTLNWALGSHAARIRYASEVLQVQPGMKVLDCGCGPGAMLDYLPGVDYTGMDMNPLHVAQAKKRHGDRGRFLHGDVTRDLNEQRRSFDIVLVSALLHHLDDEESKRLLVTAVDLARPGGHVQTLDNIWLPRQNPLAWIMNKLDSGLNVRTAEGYLSLVKELPVQVQTRTFHNLLRIPYDHFCMTLTTAA